MDQVHQLFLRDLGHLIKEHAIEAQQEARNARRKEGAGEEGAGFALGRAMAYHEVVSLIQQQAAAFGIELSDLELDDLTPERDLL